MRPLAIIAILAFALSTPTCAGSTIHGLDEAAWMALIVSDEPLPITSTDKIDYDAIAQLGPGSILFVAMRAQDRGDDALAAVMLREAMRRETGRYRTRAAELLAEALLTAGDGPGLIELGASAGSALPPYRQAYLAVVGLSRTGSFAAAAKAVTAIRSAFPADASRDAPELSAISLEARLLSGDERWKDDFAAIVAMDGSTRTYTAMAKAVSAITALDGEATERAVGAIGPRALDLAKARAAVGAKEYGQAVVAFRRWILAADMAGPATKTVRADPASAAIASAIATAASVLTLSPATAAELWRTLPRPAASDAARAFITASGEEGAAGFAILAEADAIPGSVPLRPYFDFFWHGRFLRDADDWAGAASAFSKAASVAANAADRDAADWYAIEAASKLSTDGGIVALGTALERSANPAYYSDLIETLSREALIAKKGKALAALDAAVMVKASAKDRARLSYVCARAAKTGIISYADITAVFGLYSSGPAGTSAGTASPAATGAIALGSGFADAAAYAEERMRYAYEQRADDWYRLVAAYRLGLPLVESLSIEPPPSAEPAAAADQAVTAAGPTSGSPTAVGASSKPGIAPMIRPDEYALAMARFGLGARLRTELSAEFSALNPNTIRTVALSLRSVGKHMQALRLIATLFWKSGFKPTRIDAELYWPRPYPELFAKVSSETGVEPSLLYGLARSESAFDAGAISKSGAIGLTQLMPSTAAEMAGRLKLADWTLTDPEDNLTIGGAYFARVLDGVDGRVLPAAFSYNGGPTRFKRWEAEYGSMPLDLLLETLSYAETRQYGRNVASAALSYAALYGEVDLRSYFGYLLGEGPRP